LRITLPNGSIFSVAGFVCTSVQVSSGDASIVILAGSEPVDALFVDIILNRDMQAGIELAKQAIELKPGLKVVYSTA
jgi:hypothetical protein